MKYLLALLLLAMGASPDRTPSQQGLCQFVDQATDGRWTCERLAAWARKGDHDADLPRAFTRKLAPPPEEETDDTDAGSTEISNGF